ncbi:phytanoyl-CoA dioxygenase family protein [Novosphingobium album (ex Hu et al. 2023)]|uniref:Phytanoyl-CoA dioxygenase family protein n=1 Tax=Novosphingobium album (ex Hu et al. 2023) TaxID=2930093 RepID=A0ABT0B6Y8_9SPHN|nr:phytanoyl-CoA dioxygenase family protein [Novosphingobium album (ex Hu et al. 2023)]MCJ2180830.1 phytanoyl-CoA dioxygenase family protein [Novosphingobium album (ex Hu et al. 2023)]
MTERLAMFRTLDRRTRDDAAFHAFDPESFFTAEFPALAARHGHLVAGAIRMLGVPPLAIECDGSAWTITGEGGTGQDGTIWAERGIAPGAMVLTLTGEQFGEWAQNRLTLNGMMTARSLVFREGTVRDISCWDAISHALLEGWPVTDDGLTFTDRQGAPLDLARAFTPRDDPAEIFQFLAQAGYVHLRGWLDPRDMAEICADMDRALPHYREGDGKSWWAQLSDGSRRCVRLQEFVEHSPATRRILSGETWARIRHIVSGDDTLKVLPAEGRVIEALFKPAGVVSGPSDVSFHRDCHLGRHAYSCSRRVVGIALTASSADNGLLRVVAGSHRVHMPVELAKTASYLPVIALPTEPGDVTVHLSCTLHEATRPVSAERRVMYTELPHADAVSYADTAEGELREQVTGILRDLEPRTAA